MRQRNRLYDIWHGVCRRCHDPHRKDFHRYGGKGLTVCKEWRCPVGEDLFTYEGFLAFKKWAESHGYDRTKTLDRVSNARGYSPDNCRWIGKHAQNYNKTTNRFITIGDKTKTLEEWARTYNIGPDAIIHRTDRGWTIEEAITIPKGQRRPKKE